MVKYVNGFSRNHVKGKKLLVENTSVSYTHLTLPTKRIV